MKQHWSAQIVADEAQCRAVASAASRLQAWGGLLTRGYDASEQTGAAPALVQGPQVARPVPRASGLADLSQRLGAGVEVERRRHQPDPERHTIAEILSGVRIEQSFFAVGPALQPDVDRLIFVSRAVHIRRLEAWKRSFRGVLQLVVSQPGT